MNAAKVTLTKSERETLHVDVFLMEDEWVQVEAAVESIVAARVAEALRNAAEAMHENLARDIRRHTAVTLLRLWADEYAPRADS